MRTPTKSIKNAKVEISRKEAELLDQGYRITTKSNEKDLLPGEYFITDFIGSEPSFFEGLGGATITWYPL